MPVENSLGQGEQNSATRTVAAISALTKSFADWPRSTNSYFSPITTESPIPNTKSKARAAVSRGSLPLYRKTRTQFGRACLGLSSSFSHAKVPYAVSRFESVQVQEKLDTWFEGKNFDVAVCDFLDAAVNFPQSPHNSHYSLSTQRRE